MDILSKYMQGYKLYVGVTSAFENFWISIILYQIGSQKVSFVNWLCRGTPYSRDEKEEKNHSKLALTSHRTMNMSDLSQVFKVCDISGYWQGMSGSDQPSFSLPDIETFFIDF